MLSSCLERCKLIFSSDYVLGSDPNVILYFVFYARKKKKKTVLGKLIVCSMVLLSDPDECDEDEGFRPQ